MPWNKIPKVGDKAFNWAVWIFSSQLFSSPGSKNFHNFSITLFYANVLGREQTVGERDCNQTYLLVDFSSIQEEESGEEL